MNNQITQNPYEPDEELATLLIEVLDGTEVRYDDSALKTDSKGQMFTQRSYTAELGDTELAGFETVSPVGVSLSLRGDFGFASTIVLGHAMRLGTVTLAYIDEIEVPSLDVKSYQDLTAEWNPPAVVENGFHEERLENRTVEYETEVLDLAELEKRAQMWLSERLDQ